jgi:hypothetical protein
MLLIAAPAEASTWQSWVAKPAAASCASGSVLVAPTSASTDSLGVVHLKYANYPGLTSALPPKGFSVRQASAGLRADLASSGVRPDQAQSLANAASAPEFCASSHLYSGFQASKTATSKTSASSATSGGQYAHSDGGWAGYSVDGGTGFNGVTGYWNVQQSNGSSPAPNNDGTWIGIGGDGNDCLNHSECSLIQEGTQMMTNNGYKSWFEFVCSPSGCGNSVAPQFGNAYGVSFTSTNVVGVGDEMAGAVYWKSSSTACFTLTDYSRSSGSFSGCVSGQVPYDNRSIEWIDEDGWANQGYYMADFSETHWQAQEAYSPSTGQSTMVFGNSEFSVVGNIAATSPNLNITPPCNSGVVAYPTGESTANSGSSITVWCSAGPPTTGFIQ